MSAKQKDLDSNLTLDQFFCACNLGFVRLFSQIFLMSPKGPPFIFLTICNRMNVQKSQRVPLLHFSALCDLPETSKKIDFFSIFISYGCFRREYFDTLKSFCYFRALDMAPTWAVPGLFKLTKSFSHNSPKLRMG